MNGTNQQLLFRNETSTLCLNIRAKVMKSNKDLKSLLIDGLPTLGAG